MPEKIMKYVARRWVHQEVTVDVFEQDIQEGETVQHVAIEIAQEMFDCGDTQHIEEGELHVEFVAEEVLEDD